MIKKTEKILGYSVDLMSFEEAVFFVMQKMKQNEFCQIVTINPEIIKLANENKDYSQILENAQLVIPESAGIWLALKLKGINQEQITGIDFSKRLIKECSLNNYSIALIGAKEEVIQKTTDKLKEEFPKLNISYIRNGYFNNDDEQEIISELKQNNPKLILCALGAPKQEFFIKKCMEYDCTGVFIGIGGSFDVWSGNVQRAPEIYRKFGLEWLYRTVTQPKRIKRIYNTLPIFLIKVIIEAIKGKLCR